MHRNNYNVSTDRYEYERKVLKDSEIKFFKDEHELNIFKQDLNVSSMMSVCLKQLSNWNNWGLNKYMWTFGASEVKL